MSSKGLIKSRFHIVLNYTATGVLGQESGYIIYDDTVLRIAGNLDSGDIITVQGRLTSSDTWTDIDTFEGSGVYVSDTIDISTWNYIRFYATTVTGSGSSFEASGFFNLVAASTTDSTAIHTDKAAEIITITEKTTLADDDILILEDSADSYNKKKVKFSNLCAVNPENTFTIAPSGGDYTTIQAALDANSTDSTLFLVYPGIYTNDTINFTANKQTIIAVSRPNNTIITNSSQVVEVGDFTGCALANVNIQFNPITAINGIECNDGNLQIRDCRLMLTTSSNIAGTTQPTLIAVTGTGTIKTKRGEFYYYHTGNTSTGIKTMFNVASGGMLDILRPCLSEIVNSGTASATTTGIDSGTGTLFISEACDWSVTDDTASVVVGFGYLVGSGDNEVTASKISVTGGGSNACYGIYNAGTNTVKSNYCDYDISGGATNYGFFIGGSATIESDFDNIDAADGNVVTGTLRAISSTSDGDLTVSGSLNLSSFDNFPVTPSSAPTADYQIANKKYVDDNAGGGGTPGGSDTQVQFNDSGSFGGDSGLTYDKTNNVLTVTGSTNDASTDILDLKDSDGTTALSIDTDGKIKINKTGTPIIYPSGYATSGFGFSGATQYTYSYGVAKFTMSSNYSEIKSTIHAFKTDGSAASTSVRLGSSGSLYGGMYYNTTDNELVFTQGTTESLGVGSTKVSAKLPIEYPSYTTTERDALSPSAGWVLYNSTTNKLQCYNGSSWNDLF